MIVEDERNNYNVNFNPLSAYGGVPNDSAVLEVGEETFAPCEK